VEIGTQIGDFQLSEKLSEGPDTQLWRAIPLAGQTQRRVVIRFANENQQGERVREEYEILRQLDDPRILKPIALVNDQHAVVLEHVDGVTLEEVLEAARQHLINVNLGTAVDLGMEIAHALRSVHQVVRARGRVVHGHLSPDRVMLTEKGEIKLLGLGAPPAPRPFPYQPPEIALRMPFDARTDQWLTAALICELAAVSLPDRQVTRGPHHDLHLPPTLAENLRRIDRTSPHLAEVLATALSANPQDRYNPETVFLKELYTVSRSLRQATHRHELASLVSAHRGRLYPSDDDSLLTDPAGLDAPDASGVDGYEEDEPTGQWARVGLEKTDPGVPLKIVEDLPPVTTDVEYTDPTLAEVGPPEGQRDAFSFATWLREKQYSDVETYEEEDTSAGPTYFEFTPLTDFARPDNETLAELEQSRPVVDSRFLDWSRRAAVMSVMLMLAAIFALVSMRMGWL
jgi:hypothetical protein